MTEQQTPVMTPPAAPPAAPTGPKKKRKGRGKTIAGILIVAAIAIALVVLVWYFVFREDGSKGEVMTDFVTRGSIQSMVEGSGTTKAKDSATVTPGSGTILELFVQEGDQVTAGQQLYLRQRRAALRGGRHHRTRRGDRGPEVGGQLQQGAPGRL